MIFGLLCVGSIAISSIMTFAPAIKQYNQLKKDGYIFAQKGVLKKIYNYGPGTLFNLDLCVNFFPFVNIIWALLSKLFSLGDNNPSYSQIRNELLDNGQIKKSEELLNLEAKTLIKQNKFEKAKEDLSVGKMGFYNQMDAIEKLSFINTLEERIEKKETESFGNAYDALTNSEKKEFLMKLKSEVLEDANIEVTLDKKTKRKAKVKKK